MKSAQTGSSGGAKRLSPGRATEMVDFLPGRHDPSLEHFGEQARQPRPAGIDQAARAALPRPRRPRRRAAGGRPSDNRLDRQLRVRHHGLHPRPAISAPLSLSTNPRLAVAKCDLREAAAQPARDLPVSWQCRSPAAKRGSSPCSCRRRARTTALRAVQDRLALPLRQRRPLLERFPCHVRIERIASIGEADHPASPPEDERALPAPYWSNRRTVRPRFSRCQAVQAPNTPAPITATSTTRSGPCALTGFRRSPPPPSGATAKACVGSPACLPPRHEEGYCDGSVAIAPDSGGYSALATSFSSSSCCSSPAWYISIMMSLPPTNSPLT